MAGTKGRSGRRPVAEIPPGFELPPLGEDEDSVRDHTSALSAAVQRGIVDPRVADTLLRLASTHLRALQQRASAAAVLSELRALKARLDQLELEAMGREAADRQHTAGDADEAPAVWDPKKK